MSPTIPEIYKCIAMAPEEDPTTAIGNMHKNVKFGLCVVSEVCKQTDTQT